MKLIFIYGPTGVGKLTVAEILSQKTGYRLLHNHLTVNIAKALFEFGSESYRNLVRKLRLDLVRFAAQSGLEGLIMTFVFTGQGNLAFIESLLNLCKEEKIEVHFVRLFCDVKLLEQRITGDSRARFDKPRTVKALHEMLEVWDMFATIPDIESLELDSTSMTPEQGVAEIEKYCSLMSK